jgi:SAM-dependent methyltransferase
MSETDKLTYPGKELEAMSFAHNYHKWIIDEFEPYLGKTIAEVGAGTGSVTEILTNHVEKICSFEPSENMYPLLEKAFLDNTKVQTINSFFGDADNKSKENYDSVVYINVLEHIEDDENELQIIHRALKDQGHALIFVPALTFLYSNQDKKFGHFRRYHKKNLKHLFENAGFEIIKIRYFDIAGIIPWYITFVLLKKNLNSSNVHLYDTIIVPIIRRIESLITPPLGKNLLLVAKKI